MTAAEGSDAWRPTAYGFVHDTEHALLAPLPVGAAIIGADADIVPFEDRRAQFELAPDPGRGRAALVERNQLDVERNCRR